MPLSGEKEKAVNYETLYALTGDRERSWKLLMALPDPEKPLVEAAAALSSVIEKSTEDIVSRHADIASAFAAERIETKVLFPESPFFPEQRGEFFPVVYASGNMELLKKRRVTFLGMPHPSLQGKSDAAKALGYLLEDDVAVLLSLDDGIPAFAAQLLLKNNGNVIAVLSGPVSKCQSQEEAQLRGRIYDSGLLLSVFPPSQKTERWLVMVRNSFMASVTESVFLAEEKDGGPSWSVFDRVLLSGGRAMLPSSLLDVPSYTFARKRAESGALTFSSHKDIRRLIPKMKKESSVPDLFAGL